MRRSWDTKEKIRIEAGRLWPRFCVRGRIWTRHHALVGSPVAARNYLNRITRSWIGIASLKSTPPSSESTLLCMRDDVTMIHECKQSTATSRTHETKIFLVNTFHDAFKAWMDFYRHCVCSWSYLKYAFSIYNVKSWQSNRGIPAVIVMLSNLHNYPWFVLPQRTAFQWWRHGNRGFLLAEKGIPILRKATSW